MLAEERGKWAVSQKPKFIQKKQVWIMSVWHQHYYSGLLTLILYKLSYLFEQLSLLFLMIMVLFFHSYDLILLGDPQEFVKKFLEFEANMVFSAEGFCWPDRWLKVSQVLLPQSVFILDFVCVSVSVFFYFQISKHENHQLVALLTVFIQTWLYTATKCANKHVCTVIHDFE